MSGVARAALAVLFEAASGGGSSSSTVCSESASELSAMLAAGRNDGGVPEALAPRRRVTSEERAPPPPPAAGREPSEYARPDGCVALLVAPIDDSKSSLIGASCPEACRRGLAAAAAAGEAAAEAHDSLDALTNERTLCSENLDAKKMAQFDRTNECMFL